MSECLIKDMYEFHGKFGVREAVEKLTPEMLREFLQFRIRFLEEELDELKDAADQKNNAEIVDACIDLVVVALGTLDAYQVDVEKAWNLVLAANMTKSPGIKASRPNKFGLPDMVKSPDFVSPDHSDNVGLLVKI